MCLCWYVPQSRSTKANSYKSVQSIANDIIRIVLRLKVIKATIFTLKKIQNRNKSKKETTKSAASTIYSMFNNNTLIC